jgi:hypothetical protein
MCRGLLVKIGKLLTAAAAKGAFQYISSSPGVASILTFP